MNASRLIVRRRAAALALGALLLSGCAQLPAVDTPAPAGAVIGGRLQLRTDATDQTPVRSWSAGFELLGGEREGRLTLISPLGTLLARADWGASGVRLETPDGRREFADLDQLAREALGEDLPLAALTHWLAGRPWPGAPVQPGATGFAQAGWQIDLSHFADEGRLEARRELPLPSLTVRARIDR